MSEPEMTQSPTSQAPVRFQRANYIVSDLDRSLAFYRDVIGFDVAFEKASEKTSYSYPVFEIPQEANMRWAVFSTRDQPRVMAITEVKGIDMAPVPYPRRAAIILEIADIDGLLARAHTAGAKVYREETLITHDGRKGREIGIVDPDGHLVVIYSINSRVEA